MLDMWRKGPNGLSKNLCSTTAGAPSFKAGFPVVRRERRPPGTGWGVHFFRIGSALGGV